MSFYNDELPGEGGTDERFPNPELEEDEFEEEEEMLEPKIVPPDTDSTMYPPPEDEELYIDSTGQFTSEYMGEYLGEGEYPEEGEYYDQEYMGEYGEYETTGDQGITPPAQLAPGQTEGEQLPAEATAAEGPVKPTCGGEIPEGLSEDEKLKARLLESFCCQQVQIPPLLPNILKAFTKSAIRTQPRYLEQWAGAYFRALANGETPPVKERLEYPTVQADSGLTRGLLRVLNKQLGDKQEVPFDLLREKWKALCLEPTELTKLLDVNGINGENISWNNFIVCASASIAREDVGETMSIICSVLTRQPDGVDPYINYDLWWELYTYEAQRAEIGSEVVQDLNTFLKGLAVSNYNQIGPKDFLHQNCPPIV